MQTDLTFAITRAKTLPLMAFQRVRPSSILRPHGRSQRMELKVDKNNIIVGQLVSSLTSYVVNEFRFQWAKEERPRLANENQVGVSTQYRRSWDPVTFYRRPRRTNATSLSTVCVIKGAHTLNLVVSTVRSRSLSCSGLTSSAAIRSRDFHPRPAFLMLCSSHAVMDKPR